MSRIDEDLFDFLKSEFSVEKLVESTDKAYGIAKIKQLNEDKAKKSEGEIKPAEMTDKPKETKVEKEAAKETDVDKDTQKEDSGKQKEAEGKKEEKVKEIGEGKVPENPAEVKTEDGSYQGKLTEMDNTAAQGSKKVIASGISDESIARKIANDNKGTPVQDPQSKTWSVESIQEGVEVDIKTDEKDIHITEVPGGAQVTTTEKGGETVSQGEVESPIVASPDVEEPIEDEIVEECRCGKNGTCKCDKTMKEQKFGGDTGKDADFGHEKQAEKEKKVAKDAKKQVKESKDDFTWGFAKSVQAALKQHNFTPQIEKVGDFLAKLPELDLDAVKMAIVDNDKNVLATIMNSIATGAVFVAPAKEVAPQAPVAPVAPAATPAPVETPKVEATKEELEKSEEEVKESKKVNEAGVPVGVTQGSGFATDEPVGTHEDLETPAEETAEHEIVITPELAKELIALTDLNPETDLEEFTKGLEVEMEHFESIEENKETLAKIVADHIKEFPGVSYYDALATMEEELKNQEVNKEEGTPAIEEPVETETPSAEPSADDYK